MEKEKTIDELILDKMGYTEKELNRCVDCRFVSCMHDGYELGKYYKCVLNPVMSLQVSSNGRCRFFQNKETIK